MIRRLRQRMLAVAVLAFLLGIAALASVASVPLRKVASAQASGGPMASAQIPLPKSVPQEQKPAPKAIQVYDVAALDLRPASEKTPLAEEKPKPKTENRKENSQPPKPAEPVQTRPRPQPQPKRAAPKMTVPASAPAEKPPAIPSAPSPGELPGLVVDYSAIGFDRYARFTEEAGGAFFIYTGSADLAHKVSIGGARSRLLPKDTAGLALERLYLISDAEIPGRLSDVGLPENAQRGVVILAWPLWLDRRVWEVVSASLNDSGFKPKAVSRVDARIRDTGAGLVLKIESATLREGNKRVPFAKPRSVRIQS
jgi:hypothetical protein